MYDDQNQTAGKASPHDAAFVVGQDGAGHWLALETHGLAGGLFRTQRDALRFAAFETEGRPGSVALSATPLTFRV